MTNHQEEAGIAEFVGPLLQRLKLAKKHVPQNSGMEKFIDQISPEVAKTRDFLSSREKLDRELAGCFGKIERQLDLWIDQKPREEASDLPWYQIEVGESSNASYQIDEEVPKVENFLNKLRSSNYYACICLTSLGSFPENTQLKKRVVIYWWSALFWQAGELKRYFSDMVHRDIIPICTESNKVINLFNIEHRFREWLIYMLEKCFSDLVNMKVIIPIHREHNKVIDLFTIEPIFHKRLISYCERYGHISFENGEEGTWRIYRENRELYPGMLLNLDQRYLNSKDIMNIISKHDKLAVVQLGNWCYTKTEVHNWVEESGSDETRSKRHIEVDQTNFLKLEKSVSYLSLRGISGITELPESIGKLKYLVILDLRACHNFEKLPQKPRSRLLQKLIRWKFSKQSGWFKNLEVLDISESYLLDHMPKWICELSNLQVLKGFVVGNLGNKNQSCQLGDLSKLNKLRKLSIRTAINSLHPEVFRGFNSLVRLLVLTITWGQNKSKGIPTYSLPKNIEKLDMRCYPEAETSKLKNPEELKNLKRLYIRGGNLTKIPCHDNWKVEILRLRFLKELAYPTDWNEVKSSFKNSSYVEWE